MYLRTYLELNNQFTLFIHRSVNYKRTPFFRKQERPDQHYRFDEKFAKTNLNLPPRRRGQKVRALFLRPRLFTLFRPADGNSKFPQAIKAVAIFE